MIYNLPDRPDQHLPERPDQHLIYFKLSLQARQMAERLADEQRNVSLFAYGVGRGVDKTELLNIIGTSAGNESGSKTAAVERYLDLYVQEGPIW